VIALVLLFKSSSNLAAAYGIAVTLTMLCDTILVAFVMYSLWKWSLFKVLLFFIPFICLDISFFGATSLKMLEGGWVPLVIGVGVFIIMQTWKLGKDLLRSQIKKDMMRLDLFVSSIGNSAHVVNGTAIFMNSAPEYVPHSLLHNLKHNKVVHSHNVMVTVLTDDVPMVDTANTFTLVELSPQFWTLTLHFGFKQEPNIPPILAKILTREGIPFDAMSVSYFISRERILHTKGSGMAPWREHLFISMSRNTSSASDFFHIPSNRVLELGSQVEI
jgi:KUP system potassium uptake protein